MASGDKGMSSALASMKNPNQSFSKAMGTINSAGERVSSITHYAQTKYSNDPKGKSSYLQSAKTANHVPEVDDDSAAVIGAPMERVTLVFVTLAALAAAGAVVL